MTAPETVPVPVVALEYLRDAVAQGCNSTTVHSAARPLVALIPEPDPQEVAVEAMAEAIGEEWTPRHPPARTDLTRRFARATLSALLDLGWTPPGGDRP